MILDVDVGNTRTKWLLRNGTQVAGRGAINNCEWRHNALVLKAGVDRVRVSSVQGEITGELDNFCRNQLGVIPEYATVVELPELTCGYAQPSQLGVDRWLGVLACWRNISRRALVIDAGSALTIDVLTEKGHLGGYIVPGYRMMASALGRGTWGVAAENTTAVQTPADHTSAAVYNGSLVALLGAIERVADQQQIMQLVMTGGDGEMLANSLSSRFDIIESPDLVLDGLQVALP